MFRRYTLADLFIIMTVAALWLAIVRLTVSQTYVLFSTDAPAIAGKSTGLEGR